MSLFVTPNFKNNLDLITLYSVPNGIECDDKFLYQMILASLHQKNEILFFERPQISLPQWNSTKRWEVGDDWLWISARSKAPIVKTFCGTPVSLCQFREFLTHNK